MKTIFIKGIQKSHHHNHLVCVSLRASNGGENNEVGGGFDCINYYNGL